MKRIITILFLLLASPLWAGNIPATYYVDTAGNDSNSGLAMGSAWTSVAKVNAFSRTNILLWSQAIDNEYYTKGNTTVSADNVLGPDGTTTADRLVETTAAGSVHQIYRANTLTAVPYTFSAFLKAGERTWARLSISLGGEDGVYFNLSDGTIGTTVGTGYTSGIIAYDNSWYRAWVTRTTTAVSWYQKLCLATVDNEPSYTGDASKGIYVLGLQLEAGPLSGYIPTTTASVTASFQPGDSILFKRGQTWAETLTVPSSGTSGAHIAYGAYGIGYAPRITGGVDMNGQTYVDAMFTDLWKIPSFPSFPNFPAWH